LAADIGPPGFGAHAAQAPALTPPAKSEPQQPGAAEQSPPPAAQPARDDEVTPKTPGEVTQKAGAAVGVVENGGSQVAVDCASLVKLATDLKAEVDKTTKEELSVNVVRKADEIEQLARKARKK